MKVGLFLSFILVLGMAQLSAQNVVPPRDAQRVPGTPPAPVESPEVSTDGKVTFRLRAPGAKEVLVRGISQTTLAMQKDGDGVWSVTTDALKPDLYAYSFLVDGLSIADPSNTKFRPAYRTMNQSAVLVPGANAWTPRANVRRGAVARHVFHSAVAGDDRDIWVYTPPDYDPKRKAPYPVLYLQHGLFDDSNAWVDVGSANVILDNLIAQGEAIPMIMVNTLWTPSVPSPRAEITPHRPRRHRRSRHGFAPRPGPTPDSPAARL